MHLLPVPPQRTATEVDSEMTSVTAVSVDTPVSTTQSSYTPVPLQSDPITVTLPSLDIAVFPKGHKSRCWIVLRKADPSHPEPYFEILAPWRRRDLISRLFSSVFPGEEKNQASLRKTVANVGRCVCLLTSGAKLPKCPHDAHGQTDIRSINSFITYYLGASRFIPVVNYVLIEWLEVWLSPFDLLFEYLEDEEPRLPLSRVFLKGRYKPMSYLTPEILFGNLNDEAKLIGNNLFSKKTLSSDKYLIKSTWHTPKILTSNIVSKLITEKQAPNISLGLPPREVTLFVPGSDHISFSEYIWDLVECEAVRSTDDRSIPPVAVVIAPETSSMTLNPIQSVHTTVNKERLPAGAKTL